MTNEQKKLHYKILQHYWKLLNGKEITDRQKFKIKTWMNTYNPKDIYDAMNISFEKYAKDKNMTPDEVFDKIGGILYNRNLDSTDKGKRYLINIIKKLHGSMYSETIQESVDELFYYFEKWEIKWNIIEDEIIPKVYASWDIFDCIKEIENYTKSMKNLSDDIVI
jgi:hypothetical protein